MIKENQYVECKYDNNGDLRVEKVITKEEYSSSKREVGVVRGMFKPGNWRVVNGRLK